MFRKVIIVFMFFSSLVAQDAVIKGSLGRYAKGQPNLEDFKVGGPIEISIMQMPLKSDFRIRYVAAQWLLAAQTLRLQNPSLGVSNPQVLFDRAWWLGWGAYLDATSASSRELTGAESATVYEGNFKEKRLMREQSPSELIGPRDLNQDFIIKMRNLNLSIALGMEDWNKATQALLVMENDLDLPGVDLQTVFFAAAHTGRLSTFVKVSQRLPETAIKKFHARALKNPAEVDYSALMQLAGYPLPSVDQLPSFGSFSVKNYRVRLINAEGTNVALVQEAKQLLSEWQSRDASAFVGRPFQRIGAVAHWLKPGQNDLPMTGIWGAGQIILTGYLNSSEGETRKETWILNPTGTQGLWSGSLTQETATKAGGRLLLTLETEVELLSN